VRELVNSKGAGELRLYRFGLSRETAALLGEQAARAEALGLPHGVSVFSRTNREDAVSAALADVERHFTVHQTGKSSYHYTVELPKPVTQNVADLFNGIFGR
jgi:hypothetical protein